MVVRDRPRPGEQAVGELEEVHGPSVACSVVATEIETCSNSSVTPNAMGSGALARSQAAAEYFLHHGFRNLYNLHGGIDAWSLLVDPAVPRY